MNVRRIAPLLNHRAKRDTTILNYQFSIFHSYREERQQMFLNIVKADGQAEQQVIREMKARAAGARGDIEQIVRGVMADVQQRGWDAVVEYAERFDGKAPYIVEPKVLDDAYNACDPKLIAALEKAGVELNNAAVSNIAPRLRMTALYAVAAAEHRLVAGTGNRSEAFMGYCTKWGDAAADFNPIADLSVTEVFEFLDYLDAPETIRHKAPSAGLFEGQTDEKEMGVSYAAIDRYMDGGAVTDAEAIRRMLRRRAPEALLHVDGVQGFLKVPFDAKNCDLYSISGHKIHAPKGIGALYLRQGTKFAGGQIGGGQEKNLRSGTTNTPGIMGMEAAVRNYLDNIDEYRCAMRSCKMRLAKNLTELPDVLLNGPAPEQGAPHILNASFMGVRGEVLLHALEEKEIYVSTGSACSAHKKGRNRILNAMGVIGDRQEGAIRFSFCPFNTIEEMDVVAEEISIIIAMLRRFKRR